VHRMKFVEVFSVGSKDKMFYCNSGEGAIFGRSLGGRGNI
jgi:hypothetical protein